MLGRYFERTCCPGFGLFVFLQQDMQSRRIEGPERPVIMLAVIHERDHHCFACTHSVSPAKHPRIKGGAANRRHRDSEKRTKPRIVKVCEPIGKVAFDTSEVAPQVTGDDLKQIDVTEIADAPFAQGKFDRMIGDGGCCGKVASVQGAVPACDHQVNHVAGLAASLGERDCPLGCLDRLGRGIAFNENEHPHD